MNVDQAVEYLQSNCRLFDRNVIYDKDRKGEYFCEMIIKNDSHPSLPITVTVTEDGCCLSVGQFEDIANSRKMSAEQILNAINDVIEDKIVFVLAYADDNDIGFGAPFFSRIFALTGREDDMTEEYERFMDKISKPIKKQLRFLTALKGRFLIFNYSGSINKTILR